MEYTQNYQLPLWDKEDAVLRTDFNENNQKIDAAIAAVKTEASNALTNYKTTNDAAVSTKAEQSAVDVLNATVANGMKIETGTYVGTGEYGKSTPNTLTFSFAPKVVGIVVDATSQLRSGTILIAGQTKSAGIGTTTSGGNALSLNLIWSGKSVFWYSTGSEAAHQLNDSAYTYYYFAIG